MTALIGGDSLMSKFAALCPGAATKKLYVGFGEAVADFFSDVFFVVGLVAAADDEALDGVEEFQPIFQGRFGDGLPLVEAFFAVKEFPFASDVLGVDLEFEAVFGDTFPTDFSFGHGDLFFTGGNGDNGGLR